ncbi:MAG: EamA family transporter [Methyloligellaceae bacterium]
MSPVLLGIVAALCWGLLDFAGRFASRGTSATTTVLWLTVTGLAGLTALLAWNGIWPELQLPNLWLTAVMGIGLAFATLWLFEALARGPFALVSPIAASYPVTALLFAIAMGTRPDAIQWLAMFAVIAGVIIVAVASSDSESSEMTPDQFRTVLTHAGLSHVTFAIAITAGQAAAPIYGETEATWFARIFGLAAMLIIATTSRKGTKAGKLAIPIRWLPLIVVMGCLDVAGLTTLSAAGHLPGAEIATVIGSAFGVVTILLAWILLREKIKPAQWLGMAMVFGGIAVLAM